MSEAMVAPKQDVTQALAVPQLSAGMLAMALLPEGEFAQRLAVLKQGQQRIRKIKQELMEKDVHYGVIPGTDKPALLKPGSEVLFQIYSLRPDFVERVEYGDGISSPAVRVTMRCEVHLGELAGPIVGIGYGSANSWERKHRYRRGERTCPECGVIGSVIKGKADFGGGWLCWARLGGCGAKWPAGAAAIEQQAVSDIENPDQHDLENTLLKMAKKRAQIDGALTATASSDLFTQDVEEQQEPTDDPPKRPARQSVPKQQQRTSRPGSREPGEDDAEVVEDKYPDRGYPDDVLPPERPQQRPAQQSARTPGIPCPMCGKPCGYRSRFPKANASHYCADCGHKWTPGEQK